MDERSNGGDVAPATPNAPKGAIADDFTCECNALAEYASALNVAGDCCANAVVRLQGAKSEDERDRIRNELRRFLRITILAAAVPFAALGEDFPVTKGSTP